MRITNIAISQSIEMFSILGIYSVVCAYQMINSINLNKFMSRWNKLIYLVCMLCFHDILLMIDGYRGFFRSPSHQTKHLGLDFT